MPFQRRLSGCELAVKRAVGRHRGKNPCAPANFLNSGHLLASRPRVICTNVCRVAGCALGSALPHFVCTEGNQRNIRTEAAIPPKQIAKRRVNLRRR